MFGDKSHTDLHGTLSLTPIIFTPTLFNQSAPNSTRFWRPIGYIPNLSYAKGVADRWLTKDKIQDEHLCIVCILQLRCKILNEGGFVLVVLDIMFVLRYGLITLYVTQREVTNGLGDTQTIKRDFNTKIVHICLIVKRNKSYLCLYYNTRCAQGQKEKTRWQGWWNTILQVCVKIWHQQCISQEASLHWSKTRCCIQHNYMSNWTWSSPRINA